MKKYLTILLLIAFIVPSVVFASWWNPLSWFSNWTFHETNTQTQILENRITELEKKLNNTVATTTTPAPAAKNSFILSTPTKVIPSAQTKQNVSVSQPTPKILKSNDYGLVASEAYLSEAGLIEKYYLGTSGILGLTSSDADRYINGLTSIIDKDNDLKSVAPDSETLNFTNLVIQIYNKDRNDMVNMKKTVDTYRASLQSHVTTLRNKASQLQSSSITYDEAKGHLNSKDQDSEQIKQSVDSISTSYDQLTNIIISNKDRVNSYVKTQMNRTQAEIDSLERQSNSMRSYTPPRIYTSWFTSCNVNSYSGGGTINCFSY